MLVSVFQLYCHWSVAHVYVDPLSAASPYTDSSTGRLVLLPFTGVTHVGAVVGVIVRPCAPVRVSFVGTVLPALKTLVVAEVSCAVSLIGCRKPFQAVTGMVHHPVPSTVTSGARSGVPVTVGGVVSRGDVKRVPSEGSDVPRALVAVTVKVYVLP